MKILKTVHLSRHTDGGFSSISCPGSEISQEKTKKQQLRREDGGWGPLDHRVKEQRYQDGKGPSVYVP